jgi:hypothetical protein
MGSSSFGVERDYDERHRPSRRRATCDKTASDGRFLGQTAKATDADKLDGLDSSQLLHGNGEARGNAITVQENGRPELFSFGVPGEKSGRAWLDATLFCERDTVADQILFTNESDTTANLFVDSGGDNPDVHQLGRHGDGEAYEVAKAGDSFHVQAHGSYGVATLEIATVHRGSECSAQAQGVLTSSP